MDTGPVGSEETALWPHLERIGGRISAETVCSGPGLARLHAARWPSRAEYVAPIDGVAIVERALADHGSAEGETVRLFWRLTARLAGDMALALLARGGVTLSGGILPRIVDLLDESRFRAAFEAKNPMTGLMGEIATSLIVAPDAVLAGMAAVAAAPDLYALDYATRAWITPP